MDNTYKISKNYFNNKNVLIIGDSVSAKETIGLENKTYSDLLKEHLNINTLLNAAIGGTTLTYMYEGSNIYKEYHNNSVAIDGCRVIEKLTKENKLKDFDYVFIAYGHNDQYFKCEIDQKDNYDVNDLSKCKSFKNSYRFIINTIKKYNSNAKIIILNCTYSEYDKVSISPYGNKFSYIDYRNASKQIADEYNLKYIDPWDYMKQYFDFYNDKKYYQDSVHLSYLGHEVLFNYLLDK